MITRIQSAELQAHNECINLHPRRQLRCPAGVQLHLLQPAPHRCVAHLPHPAAAQQLHATVRAAAAAAARCPCLAAGAAAATSHPCCSSPRGPATGCAGRAAQQQPRSCRATAPLHAAAQPHQKSDRPRSMVVALQPQSKLSHNPPFAVTHARACTRPSTYTVPGYCRACAANTPNTLPASSRSFTMSRSSICTVGTRDGSWPGSR